METRIMSTCLPAFHGGRLKTPVGGGALLAPAPRDCDWKSEVTS